jgi:FkbM family methyltransferase
LRFCAGRAISEGLPDGGVFLDVGAHIGYFSLQSAVRVGSGGLVVAFEPNPRTVKLLRDNIAASHAANVVIQPIACTDAEQMVTLFGNGRSSKWE